MSPDKSADTTILLVEDNADDVALTMRALKRASIGNEVLLASDGAEALEILSGRMESGLRRPGLILLDLNLPKVSGFEVLQRIRAQESTRLIPTVILTSSTEEEDILAGYNYGANAYVRKPVKFADFVETVGALGTFWLTLNEVAPGEGGPIDRGAVGR